MANTIEFIIKATDQASQVVSSIETKITTGTKKAADSLDGLAKSSDKFSGGFSKMQAGIVAANQAFDLVGRGIGMVKDVIDQTIGSTVAYAKEVRDLSTNLGITAEETSKIIQASDDYGISVEAVTGALEMAVKRGFAPNIETLAKLADEYNSIQDPVERAARLTDVFGRGWTTLTPLLKEGGKAIRDAAAEAEKLGLVLSDKDVKSARALEVQIDNLNDRVEALKLSMGKDLVPAAINVTDALGKFATIIQGSETPLDRMNRELQYSISLLGKDHPAVKAAEQALAEYARGLKDTSDSEREHNRQVAAKNNLLPDTREGMLALAEATREGGAAQDEFNRIAKETENIVRAQNGVIADAYSMAIQLTDSQKKQSEVQKELDALNEKIAARGPIRNAIIKNEKMSTEELTRTQLELAVAQEDLAGVQQKEGESAAEFALRVDTLKGKVADYSTKLGEHTAVVGGATKAEQEQKKALEEQIAVLQRTEEIDRAKGAFEALTQAFRDGALSEEQYRDRAGELNEITGLYTQSALGQATAQEVLLTKLADPRATDWFTSLLENKNALDGVTEAEQQAAEKADALAQSENLDKKTESARGYRKELDLIPPKVETEVVLKTTQDKIMAQAGDSMAERRDQFEKTKGVAENAAAAFANSANKAIGAVGDVASKTTDKVRGVADTTQTRLATLASDIVSKYDTVTGSVIGAFAQMASAAIPEIASVAAEIDKLPTYKQFVYQIVVRGQIPEPGNLPGAQRGADFIVPPNPRGGMGDYFPLLAAPGERVIVQTQAQQMQSPIVAPRGGDTVTYITNVYNPLAAAMLADKQRRDRVARSNARMGVV